MRRSLAFIFCLVFAITASAADKNAKKSDAKNTKSAAKTSSKTTASKTKPKKEEPKKKPKAPEPPPPDNSGPAIRKIEFTGVKRTPPEMLKAISDKYFKKGIYGTWTEDMLAEIRAIPIVRQANLMRDMTGNISIEIKEREPIAYLYLDKYYWMDEQGNVVQPIATGSLEDKVFFSGPWKNPEEYAKKKGSNIVMDGIHFYTQLLTGGFEEKKISEIHFDVNLGWMMYRIGSRAPVVFGTKDMPEKIERFVQVVPELTPLESSISKVDADFSDRVVVKLTSPSKEVGSSR